MPSIKFPVFTDDGEEFKTMKELKERIQNDINHFIEYKLQDSNEQNLEVTFDVQIDVPTYHPNKFVD
jgi:hypothetical protein